MFDDDYVGDPDWQLDTQAVRTGLMPSHYGEHSEAMYLTSGFVFKNAAEAADRFARRSSGAVYGRFTNPTVSMFEHRLAAMEGAEACVATASGMSAILSLCLSVLKCGDHIVASNSLFGTTWQLFTQLLGRFGITCTGVSLTDLSAWERAVRPETRLFFVETPANPLTEIGDISGLSQIARRSGALLVVDNCFCTPVLQRPLELGADIVVYSATKYLDGQGRVLGGAILGPASIVNDAVMATLRMGGATLSAFNAWVLLKSLETLSLRMRQQSESALQMALWLERQPQVRRVIYPGLVSHPQYALASRQQRAGGAMLSFEVEGGQLGAWQVIDHCRVISISANLGDTKSIITHPATTTHGRLSDAEREAVGIAPGLIRLSVGLEHPLDLQHDLQMGLHACANLQ